MTKAEEKRLQELLEKKAEEEKAEKKLWRWADAHKDALLERWKKQEAKAAKAEA